MPDIVMPFIRSINRDEELRYALRSAQQAFTDIEQVWIVGDTPRIAFKDVILIPMPHKKGPAWKDYNIHVNILAACMDERLSDNFLVLHDDNFLLNEPTRIEDYPVYYKHAWDGQGYYSETEKNTKQALPFGCDNYDLHAPHTFNKDFYVELMRSVDWSKPYGYCIKSIYFNCIPDVSKLTPIDDLKIKIRLTYDELKQAIADRPWFSLGDAAWWPPAVKLMNELYPQKSKWEI